MENAYVVKNIRESSLDFLANSCPIEAASLQNTDFLCVPVLKFVGFVVNALP